MKYLFLLLSFLLIQTAIAQPKLSDQDFSSQYRLARVYEETRDYTNAVRIYVELHKARQDFSEVSDGLFRCYFILKKFPEAEQILRDRMKTEGETFDLLLQLGATLSKEGKKEEALAAFEKANGTDPDMHPFSRATAIAGEMVKATYAEEALAYLKRMRKQNDEDNLFTGEIGSLLFKMGRYEEGTKEYLSLLEKNDNQLVFVQSHLAVITQDSLIRKSVFNTVTSNIDMKAATVPQLRLLAWCYGELKDYRHSYEIMMTLDERSMKSNVSVSGFEVYQFAERARNEGALDVAVMAYDEAIKRLQRTGNDPRREYFMGQAELGSLKVRAQIILAKPHFTKQEIADIVMRFVQYADSKLENDLALEALLRGGEIAFRYGFDLATARSLYGKMLARARGYSERMRDAIFALEEISLAEGNLAGARQHLKKISAELLIRNRAEDEETRKRVIYENSRIDYYEGSFDSAMTKLNMVASDPASDYANDAISLTTLIEENREGNDVALKLFARAELMTLAHEYALCLSAYQSILESLPTASITDDATLRAADLMAILGKPADAVTLLEQMQEKMVTSPLADRAGFRAAEIVEQEMKERSRAQKMYEDFLERYPKSPLGAEARKRARKLRGDSF